MKEHAFRAANTDMKAIRGYRFGFLYLMAARAGGGTPI